MNLHSIARGPVSSVNAEEDVLLIQAAGQSNDKGQLLPLYAAAEAVQDMRSAVAGYRIEVVQDMRFTVSG